MDRSTCRGCGAEIAWLHMPSGKAMPIDVTPVRHAGKAVLWLDDGVGRGRQAFAGPDGVTVGHESHFATCRDRAQFRRRA